MIREHRPSTRSRGELVFRRDIAFSFPSPREAAGRDRGWGVALRMPLSANLPIDPPPPTPQSELRSSRPRHALTRAEGGEKKTNSIFKQHSAFPRRITPELCSNLPPRRGRGECRVLDAPAAARVVVVNTRVSHHGCTGEPGIPARDGFNGFLRALPGDRALLSPSLREKSTKLERQRRGVRTTRLRRPHQRHSSRAHPRPPHPAPRP
jgi:hypothetical protein